MIEFSLRIKDRVVNGVFKTRLNRFSALVEIEGKEERCFLQNPGRLRELLVRDAEVFLKVAKSNNRQTSYDLIAINHNGILVSIDSKMPNKLLLEAIKEHKMEEFSMYNYVKPEFSFGHSKFDFLLTNSNDRCLLEVKSCTLVNGNKALFPDAPTERGRRHILELIKARKEGYESCVLFLIQRPDVNSFSPNDSMDPKFGKALREALKQGVKIYAYRSSFDGESITLLDKVRVIL
ncbi:MAG: DNA/RNA nuclease SfsA [Nitrososphaerales archaeon]|nr:DNA/RNA nuclease SfsA [Nitrososphaerales archaeon]